ncbi:MAG: hypothetical protein EOM87_00205 [Clostridia bacterium]|nr:hypothetical protein [Clostridia bacterium]
MILVKNVKYRILIILFCLILILGGCSNKGEFKTNFCYPTTDNHTKASNNEIVCDVVSNKSQFDINQVTMDFYFGYITDYSYGFCEEGYPTYFFQCIALYFQRIVPNQEAFFSGNLIFDDYQSMENTYFIKELSYNDFYLEQYGVTKTKKLYKRKLTYTHNESITVPKEMFTGENGKFAVVVRAVYRNELTGQYALSNAGLVKLHYKVLDENTVKLALFEL